MVDEPLLYFGATAPLCYATSYLVIEIPLAAGGIQLARVPRVPLTTTRPHPLPIRPNPSGIRPLRGFGISGAPRPMARETVFPMSLAIFPRGPAALFYIVRAPPSLAFGGDAPL